MADVMNMRVPKPAQIVMWFVDSDMTGTSEIADVIFEANAQRFARIVLGGMKPENATAYANEVEALIAGAYIARERGLVKLAQAMLDRSQELDRANG